MGSGYVWDAAGHVHALQNELAPLSTNTTSTLSTTSDEHASREGTTNVQPPSTTKQEGVDTVGGREGGSNEERTVETSPTVAIGNPAEHCYPVSVSLLRLVLRFLAPDYSTIQRETKIVYPSGRMLELASANRGHPRDKGLVWGERLVCIMNSTIL
jgi:hypothetical protein